MIRLLAVLAAVVCLGCSGKPSVQILQQQLVAKVQQETDGVFTVESFKKVNGFEKSDNTYVADVTFELVATESFENLSRKMKEKAADSPLGALGSAVGAMVIQRQFGKFEEGDRFPLERKVTYIRTENGWRVSDEE